MVYRIFKGLVMPAIMAALLLLWEYLTIKHFQFFGGLIIYFLVGFLLNLLLKKSLGYSFHIFFIIFFGLSLTICICITPSPYLRWMAWQSALENPHSIYVNELNNSQQHDLFILKEAVTLKDAMFMETFAGMGGDNGSRGMVPVVDKNYQTGDSIYAYAAFTSYIGDEGNDSWFFMDKDKDDYAKSWSEPLLNAKVVKDTSRIHIYSDLMKKTNATYRLVPFSKPTFLELNYPGDDLIYVTRKLTVLGMIMLIFAAIVHTLAAARTEKEKE